MKKLFLIPIGFIFLFSCVKRDYCNGTVYSKHNIPVPNAIVFIDEYLESDYPAHSYTAKTDKNGYYKLSFLHNKKGLLKFKCKCDSGSADGWFSEHNDIYLK